MGHAYGWGSGPLLGATSSWLFCLLISLALLDIGMRCAWAPWSVGARLPVPDDQARFWTSLPSAARAIQAYAAFFSSLEQSDVLIANLHLRQNWRDGGGDSDRLSAYWQEAASPDFIQEILTAVVADLAMWQPGTDLPAIPPMPSDRPALDSAATPPPPPVRVDVVAAGQHVVGVPRVLSRRPKTWKPCVLL